MPFTKKKYIQFIYKEKSGAATKLKLVLCLEKVSSKFKKHDQVYLGTLVIASYCYCGDNG